MRSIVTLCLFSCLAASTVAQSREEIVRGDRKKVEAEGFWMYNDIPGAFEEAKRKGKPIVVVLRCLPCHECVKLDDELVDTHPVIRPLLEKFVCVRQVATNGLDLDLFQYDTDQSFAMFFLNADRTIYGRFGTRSHRTEWVGDVSLTGLAKALNKVLMLHNQFEDVKASLAGKTGEPMEVSSPEKFPSLRGKFTDKLNYEGDVVKSCIHCHQIGDAQREFYWHARKPIPEKVLFPYPHPKAVGLVMDPNLPATVKDVQAGSAAATAGFRPGDEIATMDGQPLVSIADLQWVLHNASPEGATVPAIVQRGGRQQTVQLKLDEGWRKNGDISWRVTSWGLRRIAAGGMVLREATEEERDNLKIADGKMALRVHRVGRFGPHAAAKRAGVQEGMFLTSFDGKDDLLTEQQVHTHVVTRLTPNTKVPITLKMANGRSKQLQLPIQK